MKASIQAVAAEAGDFDRLSHIRQTESGAAGDSQQSDGGRGKT